jgi:hypothetical protein
MFRQVLSLFVAVAAIALFSQTAIRSRAEDADAEEAYAEDAYSEEDAYTEDTEAAMREEKPNVQLKLDVARVKLLEPGESDQPTAEFTAVITMTNKGKDIVGVSRTGFTFFLFDAKDQRANVLSWERPGGPDMMPLDPNEPATYRIKCRLTDHSPKTGKPYRLVAVGYASAALKTFAFKK